MHQTMISHRPYEMRETLQLPSICIPRVFKTVSKGDVYSAFQNILGENSIERVDMVYKKQGLNQYQRVFVHFRPIFKTSVSDMMYSRLSNGEDVKLVYQLPYFWKFTVSRVPKPNRD